MVKKRFLLVIAFLIIIYIAPNIKADDPAVIDSLTPYPGTSNIQQLFIESIQGATSTCAERGSVDIQFVKKQYYYGDKIDADVTIINSAPISSNIVYAVRLSRGNIVAIEQVRLKSTPPGEDKIKLSLLGKRSNFVIPQNIELGQWKLELIISMESCVISTYEYLEVVSCNDNVWNGDEEGIDCGGACSRECPEVPAVSPSLVCLGCLQNNICMPFGTRMMLSNNPVYCDISQAFAPQKGNEASCKKDYECLDNACNNNICAEKTETKTTARKVGFFKRTWCSFTSFFTIFGQDYLSCITK